MTDRPVPETYLAAAAEQLERDAPTDEQLDSAEWCLRVSKQFMTGGLWVPWHRLSAMAARHRGNDQAEARHTAEADRLAGAPVEADELPDVEAAARAP